MKYFIIENGEQAGPFSIYEMADRGLNSDTLVWAEGMDNWTPAWQVDELKRFLYGRQQTATAAPVLPPVPKQVAEPQPQEQHDTQKRKRRGGCCAVFMWITLGIMGVVVMMLVATCPDRQAHKELIRENICKAVMKDVPDDNLLSRGLSMIGGSLVSSLIDPMLDQVLEYHNYILFSTTTVNYKGKDNTTSIGICNHVFTLDESEIADALKKGVGVQ